MTSEPRQVFVLRIAAPPGAAGLHALRALLKRLLRDHGFICLHAHDERDAAAGDFSPPKVSELPAVDGADSGRNASAPGKRMQNG